jgi:hypothetical protein
LNAFVGIGISCHIVAERSILSVTSSRRPTSDDPPTQRPTGTLTMTAFTELRPIKHYSHVPYMWICW